MDQIEIRVFYGDTDAMGVVYYANYLRYFEQGRGEYLRGRGLTYRRVEEEGYRLPVTDVSCRYRKPARYDDLLLLETKVSRTRGARVEFEYTLRSEDGDVLATGTTRHAVLTENGKPTRLPAAWERLFTADPGEGKGGRLQAE